MSFGQGRWSAGLAEVRRPLPVSDFRHIFPDVAECIRDARRVCG